MVETLTDPPAVQTKWNDGASETNQSLIVNKGWQNLDAVLDSYGTLEQSLGSRVKLPDENTLPAERSAFYNKLGRPETKDDYELDRPQMPEGMTYDEKFEMTMRGVAHEAGITQSAMKALVKAFNEYQITAFGEVADEMARAVEEGDRALKEKWGADYKPNFEIVERACVELIPDTGLREKFAQLVDEKGLRNHPVFGEVFFGIGKSMLNDTFVKGQPPPPEKDYIPAYPNDPDMYRSGTDEESVRARAWHTAQGHVY